MELWVQHLCLFAGCPPASEAASVDDRERAEMILEPRERVLEDA